MTAFTYPDLPVCSHRREITAALRQNRVTIVVGETGSGKTTQLPKIAVEAAGEGSRGTVCCTQPRRIAAVSVARRIAEEIGCDIGATVGYRVRFDKRCSEQTCITLMTDGVLLAETRNDPDLRAYHTVILDEAHERSLNIDFLLGYMKLLLERRQDLRVLISSATLDTVAFADFFRDAPIIHVQGRSYPVEVRYLPRDNEQEELTAHVVRGVREVTAPHTRGDVLVFLPGEREIRDCADALAEEKLPQTAILPLFARLSLAEQQRIFRPDPVNRRIILATNVAETSLTIPGIRFVVDSGLARISRYLPGKRIQSLQTEPISQASAGQRAGRCGRTAPGICVRLCSQEDSETRPAYTDPEIRRSSLAGVILRMADLHLPPLGEFPLPNPPAPRLISEGYRTLREIGAMAPGTKTLTPIGLQLAQLPLDPRLGRILLEAQREHAVPEALVLVAALSVADPREHPFDKEAEAARAHAEWRNEESDFLGLLSLWRSMQDAATEGPTLRRNALRRWCSAHYINFRRMVEWYNLVQDLTSALKLVLHTRIPEALPPPELQATPDRIHRSVLAGVPLRIGRWHGDERVYRSPGARSFSIFPGSGLFRRKNRAPWVFGTDLAETGRLWLRRAAVLDPAWVEQVAPHLCTHRIYAPEWDPASGTVFARERVVCSGLTIVDSRRVSYAATHPAEARALMIRDGILPRRMQRSYPFLVHLEKMLDQVALAEHKLRRRDLIRCDDSVFHYFDTHLPPDCTCEKDLRHFLMQAQDPRILEIPYEECIYPGEDDAPAALYPDELHCAGQVYPVYYRHAPGEEDDGVTLGVHIDLLDNFPDWLPEWGVPAHLEQRVNLLLRSLPKAERMHLMPLAASAAKFAQLQRGRPPSGRLTAALAEFVHRATGHFLHPSEFDSCRLPPELITKIWVCNDAGEQLALGTSACELRNLLAGYRERRFREQAAHTFSSSPMTRWDCGNLPESLRIGTYTGYPALEDGGNCARVQICPTAEQAQAMHRAGVRRLVLLHCGSYLNSLRKNLPFGNPQAALALASLGAAPRDNAHDSIAAAVDSLLPPLPRSATAFEAACLRVREHVYDTLAGPVAHLWETLSAAHTALSEYLRTASPAAVRSTEDLQRQWAWLTRRRFLLTTGEDALRDIPRFTRGLIERLRRLAYRPPEDDLRRLEQFEALVPAAAFYAHYPERAVSAGWVAYGLAVEEYRLSLFAPALAVKGRTSPKKLNELRRLLPAADRPAENRS